VTADIIDWHLPNKILGCATDRRFKLKANSCVSARKASPQTNSDLATGENASIGLLASQTTSNRLQARMKRPEGQEEISKPQTLSVEGSRSFSRRFIGKNICPVF